MSYMEFLCRIKRSYISASPVFPLKYMLHKDLVPEISHDLILILSFGIAPGPRSQSQNMLTILHF
jgi:hypothetical protein